MNQLKFKDKPVVIDPYDPIVQKAVQESGLKGIDVIKLEPTCSGDRIAWVSNQDLLKGTPGKERVIHLCLNKIKDQYKKTHGQPISITDTSQYNNIKDLIKDYLKNVVLPHEKTHIDQVIEHGGKFGPSPELEAERAENWQNMQKLHGIGKMASHLDRIANTLEKLGYVGHSEQIDLITNTIEKVAAINLQSAIDTVKKSLKSIPEGNNILRFFTGKDIDSVLKLLIKEVGNKIDSANFNKAKIYAEAMYKGQDLSNLGMAATPQQVGARQAALEESLVTILPVATLMVLASFMAEIPIERLTYSDINTIIRDYKTTGTIAPKGTAQQATPGQVPTPQV